MYPSRNVIEGAGYLPMHARMILVSKILTFISQAIQMVKMCRYQLYACAPMSKKMKVQIKIAKSMDRIHDSLVPKIE